MFCYAAPDRSIASLVFFPWFYLQVDSIFALAFTDKMTKNLIATKKQQELKFFMHQNSLPAPSLPEQLFSVANETCSSRKKQQKNNTPPTSTDYDLQAWNTPLSSWNKKLDNQSDCTYHPKW